MKAIIKYRLHPSVIAMKEKCVSSFSFSFSQFERDEIIKEINNLKTNKTTQSLDIPKKLIEENSDIFGDFICKYQSTLNLFYQSFNLVSEKGLVLNTAFCKC